MTPSTPPTDRISSPISCRETARVRALSSINRREAEQVQAAVRAAGSRFSVDEHDDYDGYLSLLLTAHDGHTPALLISGRTGAIDLAVLDGDDMTALGTFARMDALILELGAMLAGDVLARPDV